MIARPSRCIAPLLLAGSIALAGASCSVEGPEGPRPAAVAQVPSAEVPAAAAPSAASETEVPTRAAVAPPVAQTAPAASASSPTKPVSSWTPETLDTGVDLSGVRVGSNAAPAAKTPPAGPAAAKKPPVQRPATSYNGGGPDMEAYAASGERLGFLSVGESAAIHDFGNLTQGDKVVHTFELETSGDAPVVVSEIKTSCGCTVAQTEVVTAEGKVPYAMGTPLEPGSKLFVGAQLDTRAKTAGVQSVITVVSSDPRGSLQLQLKAHVAPFFSIEPKMLNFGRLEPDAVAEQELVITSSIAERYMLSVMTNQMPSELSVTLAPEDPDEAGRARTWRALVVLGPNIPEGTKNYQVLFTSDQPLANTLGPNGEPQMHTVHVFARADVLGPVSAVPAFFSFGLMQPGQKVSRTARISNQDADFSMASPTPTLKGFQGDFEYPDNVTFEVVPIAEGKDYDLVMTMRAPDDFTGSFRGLVVLALDHPAKPSLEISFTGVVRPGVKPQQKPRQQ